MSEEVINVRIKRPVHRLIKIRAAINGLTISNYLHRLAREEEKADGLDKMKTR